MSNPIQIYWPSHFAPHNCPIHVRNELAMSATPDKVWTWLVRATLWPTWYVNASHVRILQGNGSDLAFGTKFRWKTFGVTITSTVLEFVPHKRIAWDARALGLEVYHAWVLQPTAEGCHVLTEETQHGWLARLGKLFMPNRMHQYHQIWLESLARQSVAGLPPTTA